MNQKEEGLLLVPLLDIHGCNHMHSLARMTLLYQAFFVVCPNNSMSTSQKFLADKWELALAEQVGQ